MQIKVTTVQLVRSKIIYLDVCYETVIEFSLLQDRYCTPSPCIMRSPLTRIIADVCVSGEFPS